jgi:hypothetical protein
MNFEIVQFHTSDQLKMLDHVRHITFVYNVNKYEF